MKDLPRFGYVALALVAAFCCMSRGWESAAGWMLFVAIIMFLNAER